MRKIPLRRPIYIGCEGQSEAGYARRLQLLAQAQGLNVHLEIAALHPGAGDPLARVKMAADRLRRQQRHRIAIADRFVLLDEDQALADPKRGQAAVRLAQQNHLHVVWQTPTFEAVLLRHLPNCTTRQPLTTPDALSALQREWPGYRKGLAALDLAAHIDISAVRRAAGVEPGLAALLRCIGLIP